MDNEQIKKEVSNKLTNFEGVPVTTVATEIFERELMMEHLRKGTKEPLEFDSLAISDEERRKRFGARVRIVRNFFGLTQAEVAEKIGITKPALTAYETGRREPPFKNLISLARFFKVSVDWLIGTNSFMHESELPF